MDAVLRAAIVYLFLLVVLRVAGRRTLAQITTFDFVLLLVIGEATQQALLGDDYSLTNAFVVILTLLGMDLVLLGLKQRFPVVARMTESLPLVLVEHGEPIPERMTKARVDVDDVLEQARTSQGIERVEQIKYAVLERNGSISVIPRS